MSSRTTKRYLARSNQLLIRLSASLRNNSREKSRRVSKNLKKDQPSMARSMVNSLSPRKSSLIMLLKSLNLPRRSLIRLTTTTLMMTIQTMVKISSKMTIIKVIKGDTLIIRILTTKGISNTTKMRILNNQEGVVLLFTDVNITKIRTRMMMSMQGWKLSNFNQIRVAELAQTSEF